MDLECKADVLCVSEAVQYLVDPEAASASEASTSPLAPAASNAAKGAAKLFDAVVGMDEPPAEMS